MTETPQGPYPYAGIPWYSTTFGRDGLITALQMLWLDPGVARGVLRRLARLPGHGRRPAVGRRAGQDPARDARRRDGGAARGAVRPLLRQRRFDAAVRPAGRPLLRAHRRRRDPCRSCGPASRRRSPGSTGWPTPMATASSNISRASELGLANQGWKDSFDAIFHADGRLAEGHIALAEVQGYVFAAKTAIARAARRARQGGAGTPARSRCRAARRTFRGGLLVPRPADLCAGARRRQAALPRAHLQCRAGAVHAASRGPSGPRAVAAGLLQPELLFRLGHPHGGQGRGALQSDVLSQRLGLAARQRADRARPRPLRPQGGGRPVVQGPVRCRHLHGSAPPARAVLRLPAPAAIAGRRSIPSPARRRPGRVPHLSH